MKYFLSLFLIFLSVHFFCQITVEEIGVMSEQIEKASELFRNYKFEKVIETINPLISNFQNQEHEGRLQERDEHLYKKSLELRAVSYYNLGKESLSKEDFISILKMDPNYILESTNSTKIMRFYNSLRESICGSLILDVSPPDSSVIIDSKNISLKNNSIYLLEGIHLLKVEMMGYDSFTKEVNILSGQATNLSVKLKPISRKVFFFIKPQGAKLFINGKFAGSADLNAAQKEEFSKYVSSNGYNPSDFYVVESLYLPQGTHKIEIGAPCHSSKIFSLPVSLDLETNKPGYVKPIELNKETLTLKIESYPSNASVEIDGTMIGKTPLKIDNFCSGEHFIRIFKENQGEFKKRYEFKEISEYEIRAKLRPTLLWIGTAYEQEIQKETISLVSDSLKKGLSLLNAFNIAFSEEVNPLLPDLFYTKGVSEGEKAKTVAELCKKYSTEGVLVAKCFLEGERQIVSLRLYIPEIEGCDEATSLLVDASDPHFVLRKFDKQGDESSLGFAVIFNEKTKTLYVSETSNCDERIKIGDRIISIGGKHISSIEDFKSEVKEANNIKLTVQRGPNVFDLEIPKMPVVNILAGEENLPRRDFLLSRQATISSENEAQKNIADLNLSISELRLGRPEKALTILEKINLENNLQCLSPTVKYLRSLALFELKRDEEAKNLLKEIKQNLSPNLTLGNDSKIYLLPLVEDLLHNR